MRRNRIGAVVVSLVLAAGSLVAQRAPAGNGDVEVMLEAAKHTEQVEGRLKDAIERYQAIATRAAAMTPARKDVAATALLQMARSQEKLGQPEARATYQRIVREYPDQPTAASAARTRLAVGTQVAELTPRRVGNYIDFPVAFSVDGRFGLTVSNSGINLLDIASRHSTALVEGKFPQAFGRTPVFSNAGDMVAYGWVEGEPRSPSAQSLSATTSLHLVPTRAAESPRALAGPSSGFFAYVPVAFAPGDDQLLVALDIAKPDAGQSLAWFNVSDGSRRSIIALEGWRGLGGAGGFQGPGGIALSPDGQWIVYSAVAREGAPDRHLYIVDRDGRETRLLVGLAGANTRPLWSPDGSRLLFVNERSGQRALMSVSVQSGGAPDTAQVVQANFSGNLVQMTRTGDVYHVSRASGGFAIFVAERGTTAPRIVETFAGQSGAWSRTNRLAFVRPAATNHDLIIRSMETGEERTLQHPGITNVSPRWFSHGNAVVVRVNAAGDGGTVGGAFYKADLITGSFNRLFALATTEHQLSGVTTLSPDDRTLYTVSRTGGAPSPWEALVAIDIATGAERVVLRFPEGGLPGQNAPGLAVSPDGQTIAIHASAGPTGPGGRILTVRIDGTEFRDVTTTRVSGPDLLRWTPDGQSLVFVDKDVTGPTAPWRTMIVPAGGGAGSPDGLDSSKFTATVPLPLIAIGSVANIDLSPDGSQLVFGSQTIDTYDLWVLENVPAYLRR